MNPRYTALALAASAVCGVSQAATFTASNEAELITAINAANASGDPTSTITLTTGFTMTTALPPLNGNVAINTNGWHMSLESVGGASLALQPGATYGTSGNLNVGNAAGTTGTLTVQGAGASGRVTLLQGLAGQANIRVLDGGVLASTGPSGIRFGGPSAAVSNGGVAHVLVNGAGSALTSGVSYFHHQGTLEVSGGGRLEARAAVNLGSMPGGFTGVVTGAGSRLVATIGNVNLGASGTATLTVADGALISANGGAGAINLATNAGGSATLNIGAAAGAAAIAPGTVLASVVNGGAGTALLNFNHNASAYDFTAPITGSTTVNHLGSGTTTLRGASTYAGATTVTGGTLRAGAANVFSANSAHTVAAGGTLDLGSFDQTLTTLSNAGTVSLSGARLTMTGAYMGNGGTMRLGVGTTGAPLVFAGGAASAAGTTQLRINNLGGLGSPTTGDGIEVISATGGATTTAQTTRDAFSLVDGEVGGGAYAYRLHAGDANGAGENWYLRSTGYRAEVPLYAVVPEQFRTLDIAMLGSRQQRVGTSRVSTDAAGGERQAWGRIFSIDRDIAQQGTVSPTSSGRLNGFQTGTDLWTHANWRGGLYVGQLEGDMRLQGTVSGAVNYAAGRNDLRSKYVGAYASWSMPSGPYVEGVLQAGFHRYRAAPAQGQASSGKGDSLVTSVEVGQGIPIASGWEVEPQLQLAYQHLSLNETGITGATIQQNTDDGWVARAGVRVKGTMGLALGSLQPYARLDVFKRSSGDDITRFIGGANNIADVTTRTGGTSGEMALGAIWQLSPRTSLYGELAKLWDLGGDARTGSGVSGSVGVKLLW